MKVTDPIAVLSDALHFLGERQVGGDARNIRRHITLLRELSDDELRDECRRAIQGLAPSSREFELSFESWLSRILLRKLRIRDTDRAALRNLTIATEAFRRRPADLPRGSALYPGQEQAAVALLGGSLVQMETGEGKTYALLPAAFALACEHEHVYIVCANEYLAWRDATRTAPFWESVGVQHGLCIEDTPDTEWSNRVIYTTLLNIVFKSMRDETDPALPEHPLTFSAVLLDDADAVLLDQANQPYSFATYLAPAAFDWGFAIEHSRALVEDETVQVSVNGWQVDATLTLDGERQLKTALGSRASLPGDYLLTRRAVELAYVATHVATEGQHYVVDGDQIHPIDLTDGLIRYGSNADWIPALAFQRGLPARPKPISTHERWTIGFLRNFDLMAGLSGTVVEESLEYFLSFGKLTVAIRPQYPRAKGLQPDLFCRTREMARNWVVEHATELSRTRPVMVITDSIPEARSILEMLEGTLGHRTVRLLTGEDERTEPQEFETAGEVGSIIVTTRFAGRGVDIRLSDEARANGGLALFSLGRAWEARHDRQFVGRAGRHGDPFCARFVNSFEDPLIKPRLQGALQARLMATVPPEDIFESPTLGKTLRFVQAEIRRDRLGSLRSSMLRSEVESSVHRQVIEWYRALRGASPDRERAAGADEFLTWSIGRFLETNLGQQFTGTDDDLLGRARARAVGEAVADALNDAITPAAIAAQIEGHRLADARRITSGLVLECLRESIQTNTSATRKLKNDQFWSLRQRFVAFAETIERMRASRAGLVVADEMSTRWLPVIPDDGTAALPALPQSGSSPDQFDAWLDHVQGQLNDGMPDDVLSRLSADCERLCAGIDRTLGEARGAVQASRVDSRLVRRSSQSAAYRTIELHCAEFLAERNAIVHRTNQRALSRHIHHRVLRDEIAELWQATEARLGSNILATLVASADPAALDDVFRLVDNRVDNPAARNRRLALPWKSTELVVDNRRRSADLLVMAFIQRSDPLLPDGLMDRAKLTDLLDTFLSHSPLSSLQTAAGVQEALDRQARRERMQDVASTRRSLNRKWIGRFLADLRETGRIPQLPTVGTRMLTFSQRLRANVTERRTALTLLGGIAIGLIFGLLANFVSIGDVRELSPVPHFVDDMLAWGLLQAGSIGGPAAIALAMGMMLASLLRSGGPPMPRSIPIVRWLMLALQLGLAVWLVGLPGGGALPFLGAFALIAGTVLVAQLIQNLVWNFETSSGVPLLSIWLCGSVAFALLPGVIDGTRAEQLAAWLCFGGLLAGFTLLRSLNVRELPVVSQHIAQASTIRESESVATRYRVTSETGWVPHLYAVVLASFGYEFGDLVARLLGASSADNTPARLFAAVFYGASVGLWVVLTIGRRLSSELWERKLNQMRQVVDPGSGLRDVGLVLSAMRQTILVRELAGQGTMLGVLLFVLWGRDIPGTTYPLALLLMFVAAFVVENAARAASPLYGLMITRAPFGYQYLDLQYAADDDADRTRAGRLWLQLKRNTTKVYGVVVGIFIVLSGISDAISVYDLIKWVVNFVS